MHSRRTRVAVIGGGISGLTLAERLTRDGDDVLVVEATARAGGVIDTVTDRGLVVERGPISLRGSSPAVAEWLQELDVDLLPAHSSASKRYLVRRGRLVRAPSPTLLSVRGWLRMAVEPLVREQSYQGESLYGLVARRFGRRLADEVLDPVVAGVFGGDPRQLDPDVFPRLAEWEQRHGSVLVGGLLHRAPGSELPRVVTVRGGLIGLVRALGERLGDRLVLDAPVVRLEPVGDRWRLHGPEIVADRVVICVPPSAVRFFDMSALGAFVSAPIAAVTVAFPRLELDGFGWLAASHERRDVLGAIWVSGVFPEHCAGLGVVRVMMGGTRDPGAVELDDNTLVQRASRALAELQGIASKPTYVDVVRVRPGIPQYSVGHFERVRRWKGPLLCGWGATGVGVVHCVEEALRLANVLRVSGTQRGRRPRE